MNPLANFLDLAAGYDDFLAAWSQVGRPGFFLEYLRGLLAQEEESLEALAANIWNLGWVNRASELLEHHFNTAGISGNIGTDNILIPRLIHCLQGMTAAAQALRMRDRAEITKLLPHLLQASAAWVDSLLESILPDDLKECQRCLDVSQGLNPDTILRTLRRSQPGSFAAGPVRDVLAFLSGDPELRRRRVLRRARVPVLLAGRSEEQGMLAWLVVEVVKNGTGELYPDPIRFAPVPMSCDFLRTPKDALAAAKQVLLSGQQGVLLDLNEVDLRWQVDGLPRDALELPQPLFGRSLGAAFGVVFTRLLWQQPVDSRHALTATIEPDGSLGRVEHVAAKTQAALEERNERGGHAVRRVIVAAEDNVQQARAAATALQRDVELAVAEARTLQQALDRLDEYTRLLDARLEREFHPCINGLQNFLAYYRGDAHTAAPFGGRDEELCQLDAFLHQDSPHRYLLVSGLAGRGKSALLTRWYDQLCDGLEHPWAIVFVPITSRYQTHSRRNVYAALGAQLARIYDQMPSNPWRISEEQWRSMIQTFLQRQPEDGRRVLIILDGLDEMLEEDIGRGLFPVPVPSWLRVVISAREKAEDLTYWQRRVGWDRRPDVGTLSILKLSLDGVRQILQEMQLPSADRNDEVAEQLFRLSNGFPLLVRLYVNLLKGRQGNPFLHPDDLKHIQPDLQGFFEAWRERLKEQSKAAEAVANRLLQVLAMALGPLPASALRKLAKIKLPDDSLPYRHVMELLRYFLEGDRTGYVFSHPEFGQYIQQHEMENDDRLYWERRLLGWFERELAELEAGAREPGQITPYVVRYCGPHVAQATCLDRMKQVEMFNRLLEEKWCRAWQAVEGLDNYAGYLGDVDRAWKLAATPDPGVTGPARESPYLGTEIRCALISSTIRTLAGQIPGELLAALVRTSHWPALQALTYVQQMTEEERRAEALSALGPHCPATLFPLAFQLARGLSSDDDRLRTFMAITVQVSPEEALTAARQLSLDQDRSRILLAVARKFSAEQRQAVFAEALEAAQQISAAEPRCRALVAVAAQLSPGQALEVIRLITVGEYRCQAIRNLIVQAGHLQPAAQTAMLLAALDLVRPVSSDSDLTGTLVAVAEQTAQLPCEPRNTVQAKVMDVARLISDAILRDQVIVAVAAQQSPARALKTIRRVSTDQHRSDALKGLAARISNLSDQEHAGVLTKALELARKIPYPIDSDQAMKALARHLPADRRGVVEAEINNREMEAREAREKERDGMMPFPSFSRRDFLKIGAFGAGLTLPDLLRAQNAVDVQGKPTRNQSDIMIYLSGGPSHMDMWDLKPEAPSEYRGEFRPTEMVAELTDLVTELPPEERPAELLDQLDRARTVRDDATRTRTIAAVVTASAVLAPAKCAGLLTRAVHVARVISDEEARLQTMAALTALLPVEGRGEMLLEALVVLGSLPNDESRCHHLEVLIPLAAHLPSAQRTTVLEAAVRTARSLASAQFRGRALVTVAALLPPEKAVTLWEEGLDTISSLSDGQSRTATLRDLLERAGQTPVENQPVILLRLVEWLRLLPDETLRNQSLQDLVEQVIQLPTALQGSVLLAVVDVAQGNSVQSASSSVLATVAGSLPSSQGLAIARSLIAPPLRAQVLLKLATQIPDPESRTEVLLEALEVLPSVPDDSARSQTLQELVALTADLPRPLPAGVLQAAREVAQGISSVCDRGRALMAVALGSPLRMALEVVPLIPIHEYQTRTVKDLAAQVAQLPGEEREELLAHLLTLAWNIPNDTDGSQGLAAVAIHLPPQQQVEVLTEALQLARRVSVQYFRNQALLTVAAHLPPAEALDAIKDIADSAIRCKALENLAKRVMRRASRSAEENRAEVLVEAVAVVGFISNDESRCLTLEELVSRSAHVPPAHRPALLEAALGTAHGIQSSYFHSRALMAVAAHVSPEDRVALWGEALEIIALIADDSTRGRALGEVTKKTVQLTVEERGVVLLKILEILRLLLDEEARSQSLKALAVQAAQLPLPQQIAVLVALVDVVRSFSADNYRGQILDHLARQVGQLPAEHRVTMLPEILDLARHISAETLRSECLAVFAGALPREERQPIIQEAEPVIALAYGAWAPLLAQQPRSELHRWWRSTLHDCAGKTRRDLLGDLQALLPVIERLGGTPALEQVADAIIEVGERWP